MLRRMMIPAAVALAFTAAGCGSEDKGTQR